MFYFVVYSSQFIRKMKGYGIIVSHRQFVNEAEYRKHILDEAFRINDKETQMLARNLQELEHLL